MLPAAIIDLIKNKRSRGDSLGVIAKELCLSKLTVQYAVSNNYNRNKKKPGPKWRITKRQQLQVKRECEKMAGAKIKR
jgi:orotate phosphoribosyltransferase-like protein